MSIDEISKLVAAILYPAAIFYGVYKLTPLISKAIDKFAMIKVGNTTFSMGEEIERAKEKLTESEEGISYDKKNNEEIIIDPITSSRIESDPLGVIDDAWQNLQLIIIKLLSIHKIDTDKRRIRLGIAELSMKKVITKEFAETLEIARSTFRRVMSPYGEMLDSQAIREYIRLTRQASDALSLLISRNK